MSVFLDKMKIMSVFLDKMKMMSVFSDKMKSHVSVLRQYNVQKFYLQLLKTKQKTHNTQSKHDESHEVLQKNMGEPRCSRSVSNTCFP
jgi:hypothetical protein